MEIATGCGAHPTSRLPSLLRAIPTAQQSEFPFRRAVAGCIVQACPNALTTNLPVIAPCDGIVIRNPNKSI